MNNQVIFAAAGYGKTYYLCSKAKEMVTSSKKSVMLISYTNEGVHALENEYRKQNSGVLDEKVVIKSWYSILLSELIKPYQCLLKLKVKRYKRDEDFSFPENFIKAVAFYETEQQQRFYNKEHLQYFVNDRGDVIPDKGSHLAYICNEHSDSKPIVRLENIYSHIFIDELQDYAGWDLEIILLMFNSQIQVTCVGDYKQATYRTNNSLKNKQYRDEKIIDFFQVLEREGCCTVSYANTTRRFNKDICDFVNTIHGADGANIKPSTDVVLDDTVNNIGVFIIDNKYLNTYCNFYRPTILRYDRKAKVNFQHNCDVFNYGSVKGATYDRVVIVPVSTTIPFLERQAKISSNKTRAKFYVACTRAKYSIVFAMENPKENSAFVYTEIKLGDIVLPAYRFRGNGNDLNNIIIDGS